MLLALCQVIISSFLHQALILARSGISICHYKLPKENIRRLFSEHQLPSLISGATPESEREGTDQTSLRQRLVAFPNNRNPEPLFLEKQRQSSFSRIYASRLVCEYVTRISEAIVRVKMTRDAFLDQVPCHLTNTKPKPHRPTHVQERFNARQPTAI